MINYRSESVLVHHLESHSEVGDFWSADPEQGVDAAGLCAGMRRFLYIFDLHKGQAGIPEELFTVRSPQ